ncbi:MAG: hypothetical protein ACHQT8_05105 [Chlamydiales bacterium]
MKKKQQKKKVRKAGRELAGEHTKKIRGGTSKVPDLLIGKEPGALPYGL